MKKSLYQMMIELGNGRASSAMMKRFATSSISRPLIPGFIKTFNIDVAGLPQSPGQYKTMHDFFTRQLAEASRPVAASDFVSPVDGRVEIAGAITENSRFTVKGIDYSLVDLLGAEKLAKRYEQGRYAILYLSPADYHRIHSPVDGSVIRQYGLGEKSYPVNRLGLTYGKSPISGNRRLITELETDAGRLLVVKVGAMYINSIELTEMGREWRKGAEVGYFSFGSTVALFFESQAVEFNDKIYAGGRIKVGEPLADMV